MSALGTGAGADPDYDRTIERWEKLSANMVFEYHSSP
jgi:hypothetical protein